jgi:NAD-dependent deacetylase
VKYPQDESGKKFHMREFFPVYNLNSGGQATQSPNSNAVIAESVPGIGSSRVIFLDNMENAEQAIDLIRKSDRIVAFSGAGISTEAGIPDFRGPGGLWEDSALMEQLSLSGFRRNPEGFYRANVKLFSEIRSAEPTLAHKLLVRLEQLGKIGAVVTQNIDGLHRAAGSKRVFELHGTYHTGHCLKCRAKFKMENFYLEIQSGRLKVPLCPDCAATIKPDVVLFEDPIPVDAWEGAVYAAEHCDLMLVLGSSLVVYPAAELPMIAISSGAPVVIVNLEDTVYDSLAKIVVRGKLGEFAKSALAAFL